jgi:hypothetical protein
MAARQPTVLSAKGDRPKPSRGRTFFTIGSPAVVTLSMGFLLLASLAWQCGRTLSPYCVISPTAPPRRRTPVTQALRDAALWRMRAREVVKREMEECEQATQDMPGVESSEAMRRRLMAQDGSGELRRALGAAAKAEAMARTPREAYQVAELEVLLQCEAGHHLQELREACRLVQLRPDSPRAWMVFRRAAICNRRAPLCRRAGSRLEALEAGSKPSASE